MSYKAQQLHLQLLEKAQEIEIGCRQFPDAYFMTGEQEDDLSLNRLAISICNACPLQKLCLEYSLEANEPYGIWGGKTASQRKRIRYGELQVAK
jgi:WhiB family transcriptional regulator, redox-sensing transcriptional regulator